MMARCQAGQPFVSNDHRSVAAALPFPTNLLQPLAGVSDHKVLAKSQVEFSNAFDGRVVAPSGRGRWAGLLVAGRAAGNRTGVTGVAAVQKKSPRRLTRADTNGQRLP